VPGDKSISHRAILLSALAEGPSVVRGLSDGADVRHTLAAVAALGAEVAEHEGAVTISGGVLRAPAASLDVGNSGTGIRLLAGIVAGLPFRTRIDGDESVRSRPMDRVAEPLRLMGARIEGREGGRYAPLLIDGGRLHGIEYSTPVASAQIKSAILLAGLGAEGTTTIHEPSVSRRHTEEMLAARGVDVVVDGTTTTLTPSRVSPLDCTVAGDPSQAAFWLATAAAVPGSEVTVEGLYLGTARSGFLDVLLRMGADVRMGTGADGLSDATVTGRTLRATDVEPGEIPGLVDEIPILAVVAALAEGTTRIRGAQELRVKETDRLTTIAAMLQALGVTVVEHADGLDVTGGAIRAGTVDSCGDHRIAMAAAMAAVTASGPTSVRHFDAVATSYPGFLRDLRLCAPDALVEDSRD
jgi:3-phosphoshikimate 1-carboxyvinyltransferase